MKIECPVCGIMGFLEVRKRSARIKHYIGMKDNKRIYTIHKIPKEMLLQLIPTDSQNKLGIKTLNLDFNLENKTGLGGSAVEQQPRKLRVAGSNPARGSI